MQRKWENSCKQPPARKRNANRSEKPHRLRFRLMIMDFRLGKPFAPSASELHHHVSRSRLTHDARACPCDGKLVEVVYAAGLSQIPICLNRAADCRDNSNLPASTDVLAALWLSGCAGRRLNSFSGNFFLVMLDARRTCVSL